MALKDTVNTMKNLLCTICDDLDRSAAGNKAASQRVRTSSIRFAKVAKMYRKESVAAERKGGGKRGGGSPKKKASSAKRRPTAKLKKR